MMTTKYKNFLGLVVWFFLSAFITEEMFAQDLSKVLANLRSSFRAKISYSVDGNLLKQGEISYSYPNKIFIEFINGDVIVSNGKYLWLYDAAAMLCVKQEVRAGNFVSVHSKNSTEVLANRVVFRSGNQKITMIIREQLPRSILFESLSQNGRQQRFDLSNWQVGITINPSLFFYKPPHSAQVIENPFRKGK